MNTKHIILPFFLLIFTFNISAQDDYHHLRTYSKSELIEDLSYLHNLLIEGHPGLYWYSSASVFSTNIDKIENSLKPNMTELEFLNEVAKLNNIIKCAHSDIRPSNNYDKFWRDSVSLIPINIMKVNSEYVVYQNLSDKKQLSFGTKLISINDNEISEIVEHLLQFIPSDGDNQTRKFNALKSGFYRYYSYYFDSTSKSFKIVYENNTGQQSEVLIQGIKKDAFDEKRRSLELSQSHKAPISFEIVDSLSTGILKILSFRNDLMVNENIVFENYINDCFKRLDKSKCENLIIDLRGNAGGYSEYAAVLFSFLSDSTFEYCKKQVVTTDKLIKGVEYDIPETFNGFPNGIVFNNGQYQWTKHSILGLRHPSEFKFTGNVYFLIDGGCSSTTSELASLARSSNVGTFIGQEVGGCYMGNSGGVLGWFELPNTNLRVRMAMVKYEITDGKTLNKHGVLPDFKVEYTVEDLRQGRDLEMELTFLKIKEHNSTFKVSE